MFKIKPKTLLVVLLVATSILLVGASSLTNHKVDICHATSSESNPFTTNNVDADSILKNNGHDSHDGDIIPAFNYVIVNNQEYIVPEGPSYTHQYPGKNLDTDYNGITGAEVLAAGCVVPPPPPAYDFTWDVERTCNVDGSTHYDGSLDIDPDWGLSKEPDGKYYVVRINGISYLPTTFSGDVTSNLNLDIRVKWYTNWGSFAAMRDHSVVIEPLSCPAPPDYQISLAVSQWCSAEGNSILQTVWSRLENLGGVIHVEAVGSAGTFVLYSGDSSLLSNINSMPVPPGFYTVTATLTVGTEVVATDVKEITIESCYVACLPENTTTTEENLVDWHNVGDPYGFGDWVDQGDGTFLATGLQYQEKSWDDVITDNKTGEVCSIVPQERDREVPAYRYDDECSEGNTEWLPIQYGEWYDVNGPEWGDWYDPLNGISYRNGVQATARDWTQELVDVRNGAFCDFRGGTEEGEREICDEKCSPRWTGRFLQTYIRSAEDKEHYVTFCYLVVPPEADLNGDGKVSEKEARAWEWDDAYLAEKCSKSCESPTWQGDLDKREVGTFKEMKDICGCGNLFGRGTHYDTGCEDSGNVCDWLGQ